MLSHGVRNSISRKLRASSILNFPCNSSFLYFHEQSVVYLHVFSLVKHVLPFALSYFWMAHGDTDRLPRIFNGALNSAQILLITELCFHQRAFV